MILLLLRLAQAAEPEFGADVSAGWTLGTLTGPWPESGVHGAALARYDAFTVRKTRAGPRLGASFWGAISTPPTQFGLDSDGEVPIRYLHYGLMAVLRYDPESTWTGGGGIGFGRLDLDSYYGGPHALPTLGFEASLRRRLPDPLYVDALLRAHWSTARSGFDPTALEEWWLVQGGLQVGMHLR